ncbi:hypothetical protein [Uliginosibacterium gangwonense]|uniref:hypothetical protein n=1 Tax=Uliginosibacterium gangwonense TaxID=392736 RepID=UPI00036571E2|nr:hypothetical protein [Uliginosibacterium gangwonense]
MSNAFPAEVMSILVAVESEWPSLVGEDWGNLEVRYRCLRSQLQGATSVSPDRVVADLVALFAPYAPARERLRAALATQGDAGVMLATLLDLAKQLNLDNSESVSLLLEEAQRDPQETRLIKQKHPTEAFSYKLGNINWEFDGISTLSACVLTTVGKEVIHQPSGILIAAGILAVLGSLYKAVKVKIPEREATVFWGLVRSPKQDDGAITEAMLLEHVNAARQSVGRDALKPIELTSSLHDLKRMRSVEQMVDHPDTWRIVEKHKAHAL